MLSVRALPVAHPSPLPPPPQGKHGSEAAKAGVSHRMAGVHLYSPLLEFWAMPGPRNAMGPSSLWVLYPSLGGTSGILVVEASPK